MFLELALALAVVVVVVVVWKTVRSRARRQTAEAPSHGRAARIAAAGPAAHPAVEHGGGGYESPVHYVAAAPMEVESSMDMKPEKVPDFYNDVAALLLKVIESEPGRRDLRHKLLQIYFSAQMRDLFQAQAEAYMKVLQGKDDQYWPDIARMGRELFPLSSLYGDRPETLVKLEEPVAALGAVPRSQQFTRFYETVNQAKLGARQAELEAAWAKYAISTEFKKEFNGLLQQHLNRPTAMQHLARLSQENGGAQLYRKFEDQRAANDVLLINAIGLCLLGRHMGKSRMVTATFSGWHGIAVATAVKLLGLHCVVYMNERDQASHRDSVAKMRELGAEVIAVRPSMVASVDDVRVRALDDWNQNPEASFYVSDLGAGPPPYPSIVMNLQGVVGSESRAQLFEQIRGLPQAVVAATGDGISAIGLLQGFIPASRINLYCVETPVGSEAQDRRHRFEREHAWLRVSGRVAYVSVTEAETQKAIADARQYHDWSLDPAAGQVLAQACRIARELPRNQAVLLMLPRTEAAA